MRSFRVSLYLCDDGRNNFWLLGGIALSFLGRFVDSIGSYQISSGNGLHSCGDFLRNSVDLRLDRINTLPDWRPLKPEFIRGYASFTFELR